MKKNENKSKIYLLIFILFVIILLGIFFLLNRETKEPTIEPDDVVDYHFMKNGDKEYSYNTQLIPFLFIGVDARDGSLDGLADSISLVVFDRGQSKMKLIAISRESMIPIKIYSPSGDFLNWETRHLAYSFSFGNDDKHSAFLTAEAVSKLFNEVPIPYTVATNIASIADLHQIVGDLEVVVPNNSLKEEGFIQGQKALITKDNVQMFLQKRDITVAYTNQTRMERQQVYIEAYIQELKNKLNTDFDSTLDQVMRVMQKTSTNVSLDEVPAFLEMLLSYQFNAEEDYYTLKGNLVEGEFHDEFYVDERALKELTIDLFYEEETK